MRYRRSSVKTKSLLGNIFARKERMVTFIQPNNSMITSILYIYKTRHYELQGLWICMESQFGINNIVLSCIFRNLGLLIFTAWQNWKNEDSQEKLL